MRNTTSNVSTKGPSSSKTFPRNVSRSRIPYIGSTPTFYISICISTPPTQHITFIDTITDSFEYNAVLIGCHECPKNVPRWSRSNDERYLKIRGRWRFLTSSVRTKFPRELIASTYSPVFSRNLPFGWAVSAAALNRPGNSGGSWDPRSKKIFWL